MDQTREKLYEEIDGLLAAGDHRRAAELYEDLGELGRARGLLEGLFDYPGAGRLAEAQGDLIGALELYLKGNRIQPAEAVRRALMADLSDDLPVALELFEQRGFFLQAAELAESIGRLARAAELYGKASTHLKAARLLERLGRLRAAGEAYEAALVGQPEDPESNLGLGRILQRFGNHREALRLLGHAVAHPACADEAARRIAYGFFKLGFVEAGRSALAMAGLSRTLDPETFMRPFEDELQHADEAASEATAGSGALEGRYRMEKPLGGRIGAAFLGRDLLADRPVVLRFFAGSARDNADFYDELERLQRASLRGHVRVLEINREGGFVVTEYVDGSSLLHALRGEQPPEALPCRGYALQVLDAVEAAHRVGVLHGALTPSAVRLAPGGSCLVDDWGVRHIEKRMATQTGGPESTFAYRAPEVNLGRAADFRADLYSVAAILYRSLQGQAPLLGRGGEGFEDWPEGFAGFFAQALHPEPDGRHPSHDMFRRSLSALPWVQVARRRLSPEAPQAFGDGEQDRGPRFVTESEPEPGELVTARDTLLDRPVRLLRLPPPEKRPVRLVDRLTALAAPEVSVLQDVLRYDEEGQAIILEIMPGEPISTLVARQGAIEPVVALDAGEALLEALARIHMEGIGLGGVGPDSIRFDGGGLRVPIERSLLVPPDHDPEAIRADTRGFWEGFLLSIAGRHVGDPGPRALVERLHGLDHLLDHDLQGLLDACPPEGGSLAPFPAWFQDVRRAVDACLARQAVFERLTAVLGSEGELSREQEDWIAQRRRIFGLG